MEQSQEVSDVVRFADFEANLRSRELFRHGRKVKVPDQSFAVLAMLLEKSGKLVRREEIQKRLWSSDTFVDFDHGLNNAIKRLREALGDSADVPKFVETLPRRGYKFIGVLEHAEVPGAEELIQKDASSRPAGSRSRTRFVKTIILALTAVVCVALLVFKPYRSKRNEAASRIRSIAVLPLTNLSGEAEQEYFADGMTEALINDLCKIGTLRVISRTSIMQYKATQKPLPEIAHELSVDAIIEGSVQRSRDRVRISAQLIDGKTDENLWAQTFDRDLTDVLILQSEVARAVASEIRIELTPADEARIPPPMTVNRKAHDAYLRGRYAWTQRTKKGALEQSIAFYKQALDEDPHYALAYAGMADSYVVLEDIGLIPANEANPQIEMAAMKAVEADPALAEAHLMLADVKETEWDWAGAEQEYKRAIDLNPGLARAHHWYAILLSSQKRNSEAIAEIERAVELEPLMPNLYVIRANIYYLAGRYDEALRMLNSSPTLRATDPNVRSVSAKIELQTGNYPAAIAKFRSVLDSEGADVDDLADDLAFLGYAYALAGRKSDALSVLNKVQRLRRTQYVNPGLTVKIWIGLGKKDRALTLLEEGYRLHSSFLMSLASDPVFAPLYSDERFQDLLRRIGLPSN